MGISSFPATGGKTRKVQVFNASGTWTRPLGVDLVDVFVVAGGGGGGSVSSTGEQTGGGCSGGGAGGEVINKEAYPVSGNVSVVIGAGGAAGPIGGGPAIPALAGTGGDSSFGALTAKGGGPGEGFAFGNYDSQVYRQAIPYQPGNGGGIVNSAGPTYPASGGSGAGGHSPSVNYSGPSNSTGTMGRSSDGLAMNGVQHSGGGAMNVGGGGTTMAPSQSVKGAGGVGVSGYGAGGGGGSSYYTASDPSVIIPGGSAWAGTGGYNNQNPPSNRPGGAAVANTGCGGGGAVRNQAAGTPGGAGASGVVIVAWWE